jgi:hypothetical protein
MVPALTKRTGQAFFGVDIIGGHTCSLYSA